MDIVHGHCPGDNDLYFGYNEVIKTLILVIMNSANGWQGGHCPEYIRNIFGIYKGPDRYCVVVLTASE